jgi:hypothetical protein
MKCPLKVIKTIHQVTCDLKTETIEFGECDETKCMSYGSCRCQHPDVRMIKNENSI